MASSKAMKLKVLSRPIQQQHTAETRAVLLTPSQGESFRIVGHSVGTLHISCTPAGIEAPFRAVRPLDSSSGVPASSPPSIERISDIFAEYGVTFLGPPLH